MMKDFFININGSITKGPEARISVFDRGFLYGDSVYEATRTFNEKPFRLDKHLERLFLSAEKLDITPTFTKTQIEHQVKETIKHSQFKNASLRIILSR